MPALIAAFAQIGQAGQIGEDIVAIEANERIAVEKNRHYAADQCYRQHQFAPEAVGQQGPGNQRQTGQQQFDDDAGGTDRGTLSTRSQQVGVTGIDIGGGHQHQQRDAKFAGSATEMAQSDAVRQFMNDLDEGVGTPEQQPE